MRRILIFSLFCAGLLVAGISAAPVPLRNHPPDLMNPGDLEVQEGYPISFHLRAMDTDADTLTYSSLPPVPGATLDPATGLFTWTPASSQIGTHRMTFTVSDGRYRDAEEILITVVPERIAASADTFVDAGFTTTYDGQRRRIPVRDANFGSLPALSVVRGRVGGLGDYLYWQGSLIRLDLAQAPAGFSRAEIFLTLTRSEHEPIAIYRMRVPWEEMEASFTRPCSGCAPWDSGWNPGTNYAAIPTGTVLANDVKGSVIALDVTEDVQSMRAGASNYGWFIRSAAPPGATDITQTAFYSREAGGSRPYLGTTLHNPRVRARELREQGATASEAADALHREFGLSAGLTSAILLDEGFPLNGVAEGLREVFGLDAEHTARTLMEAAVPVTGIGTVLRDVFGMDAGGTTAILRVNGWSARPAYYVLMQVFGIADVIEAERILYGAGYPMEEYLEFTALESVQKFAPRVGFDRAHRGLPMSAETYFTRVLTPVISIPQWTITWVPRADAPDRLCGRDECAQGMHNNDLGLLHAGSVPTYYQVISDVDTGRLRIQYWWYYGFQGPCNTFNEGPDGAHHGDWERIYVTTSPDRSRIDAVTYGQHSGWYTRLTGSFGTSGTHPLVYTGKIAHGTYHDRCHAPECSDALPGLECRYFGDFRNPDADDWWDTGMNLVSLRSLSETWMDADRIGGRLPDAIDGYFITGWRWGPNIDYCNVWIFWCWDWETDTACGNHPTQNEPSWAMGHCSDDGCDRSQGWPTGLTGAPAPITEAPILTTGSSPTPVADEIREVMARAIAGTLGMTLDDVKTADSQGRSICSLAEENGLDLTYVWKEGAGIRQETLRQAVEEGLVTEEQAAWIIERMAAFDPVGECDHVPASPAIPGRDCPSCGSSGTGGS
jgi:hypothetical protein